MPTITLNGKQTTVESGLTILEAAEANGVKIPHFCFHPELPVDGCCRMCLTEVERMPKLVISCNTLVADGMVVHTESKAVISARKAVLEFMLVNHPLDCPICDQAGECRLQSYAFKYGISHSRFREEKRPGRKRHKIGPRVVYDEERCILCRRCVRFCREIVDTGEIAVLYRGDKSIIDTYPGKFLDNPYSVNTADICPVGALTSADFRFKARVWNLEVTPSVCPGCSNACSIRICHRDGIIHRLLPGRNKNVNKTWMCDEGRLVYKQVNAENRLTSPLIKKGENLEEASWKEAFAAMANGLGKIENKRIGGIASAHGTNEECYLFAGLIENVLNGRNIGFFTPSGPRDGFLLKEERAANPQGARELALAQNGTRSDNNRLEVLNNSELKALYLVGNDLLGDPSTDADVLKALSKLDFLIVQDTHRTDLCSEADVVFPSALFAEKEGTFTNINGFVQKLNPAFPPPGQAKTDLEILAGAARAFGKPFESTEPARIMAEISDRFRSFKNIGYDKLENAKVGATIEKG